MKAKIFFLCFKRFLMSLTVVFTDLIFKSKTYLKDYCYYYFFFFTRFYRRIKQKKNHKKKGSFTFRRGDEKNNIILCTPGGGVNVLNTVLIAVCDYFYKLCGPVLFMFFFFWCFFFLPDRTHLLRVQYIRFDKYPLS